MYIHIHNTHIQDSYIRYEICMYVLTYVSHVNIFEVHRDGCALTKLKIHSKVSLVDSVQQSITC
jgi:hypothetical protein